MLAIHIAIALISVINAAIAAIFPSELKLRLSYILGVGTMISGAALLFVYPDRLGHICLSGMVYLVLLTTLTLIIRKRLSFIPA